MIGNKKYVFNPPYLLNMSKKKLNTYLNTQIFNNTFCNLMIFQNPERITISRTRKQEKLQIAKHSTELKIMLPQMKGRLKLGKMWPPMAIPYFYHCNRWRFMIQWRHLGEFLTYHICNICYAPHFNCNV